MRAHWRMRLVRLLGLFVALGVAVSSDVLFPGTPLATPWGRLVWAVLAACCGVATWEVNQRRRIARLRSVNELARQVSAAPDMQSMLEIGTGRAARLMRA